MNLIKILVAISCVILSNCSQFSEIDTISTAIAEICDKFFIQKSIKFDIILYGTPTIRLHDIISGILSKIVSQSAITVQYVNDTLRFQHSLEHSAVTFVSNEYFLNHFSDLAQFGNEFEKELKFLIFYEEAFNYFANHQKPTIGSYYTDQILLKSYQFFIGYYRHADVLILFTIDHFGYNFCNKPKFTSVDRYYMSNRTWMSNLTAYEKFNNFYGCNLTVLELWGPNMYPKQRFTEVTECFRIEAENCWQLLSEIATTIGLQGFTYDIFSIVSKIANFTPIFKVQILNSVYDEIFVMPVVKLYVGIFNEIHTGYAPTSMTFDNSFVLATTPSEFFNNYEKLWMPFDRPTWIILLFTFATIFTVILCLNFMPRMVRDSIFGPENSSPGLNVIQIFFGISQSKMPISSIPRFILILIIGFCLIFRTCYQSMSFDFMTSNMRKLPPSTIQDLYERNYTILTCAFGHDVILEEILVDENSWYVLILQ